MRKKVLASILLTFLLITGFSVAQAQSLETIEQALLRIRQQLGQLETGSTTSNSSGSGQSCAIFNRTMYIGDNDFSTAGQVSALQRYLRDRGFFTYPEITGYYGSVTVDSVKRFQASRGIVSSGDANTTGFGVVGPRTLSFINTSCGSNSSSSFYNSSTSNNGGISLYLDTNKDEYEANERILITGKITNNSGVDIEGPVSNCTGMTVDINKPYYGYIQGPFPCYTYETVITLRNGESATYKVELVPEQPERIAEGKYKLTVIFPGNNKAYIDFKISNDADTVLEESVTTKVTLNKEIFKPGETIIVSGTIANNTSSSIVDNLDSCEAIKLDVDGLEDVGICNDYFNLDDVIYAGQAKSYNAYFTLVDDVSEGTYEMEVTFPGGFKEIVDFSIEE
ncbi:peptidoglycan-binding protein [Candidatus Nomurabacteria bacterium]|nr:peptidoglycan-binding protein [Candidatus Nomurabacteria bacterium]